MQIHPLHRLNSSKFEHFVSFSHGGGGDTPHRSHASVNESQRGWPRGAGLQSLARLPHTPRSLVWSPGRGSPPAVSREKWKCTGRVGSAVTHCWDFRGKRHCRVCRSRSHARSWAGGAPPDTRVGRGPFGALASKCAEISAWCCGVTPAKRKHHRDRNATAPSSASRRPRQKAPAGEAPHAHRVHAPSPAREAVADRKATGPELTSRLSVWSLCAKRFATCPLVR